MTSPVQVRSDFSATTLRTWHLWRSTLCAGMLLWYRKAQVLTTGPQMCLRQITHRSPCRESAGENRGSSGQFSSTGITAHACQTARDCVCAYVCLLSPQVSRSRSPLTAGARDGSFCAALPELSEGVRILCPRANERARDRASSAGLCSVQRAQKAGRRKDRGGVYTSSDPAPPLPTGVPQLPRWH